MGVAKAVGGGYCRLPMPLKLALVVRGTVAGHRLGALDGGGGGGCGCLPAPLGLNSPPPSPQKKTSTRRSTRYPGFIRMLRHSLRDAAARVPVCMGIDGPSVRMEGAVPFGGSTAESYWSSVLQLGTPNKTPRGIFRF